jgi:cytoskeleton protein RodZ
MPVDAGVMTPGFDLAGRDANPARTGDSLETAESLGAALRGRREAQGLDLEQLSLATRIRPQYLAALEAMRLDELPSRPFAIGYVRAYASAVGLDPEQAVIRYKLEAPDRDPVRAAPVGVDREGDPRFTMVIVAGVLVIAAIVAWNIAQHVMSRPASARRTQAVAARIVNSSKPPSGPVSLGAPLPPPTESTTPEPYVTPGLNAAPGGNASAAPSITAPAPAVGTPFQAKGPVYGAPAANALVILQAEKPTSVVVRGADGTVYFARQLETGEAYGASTLPGLTVEVSNPATVSVYVGRALKGPLPAATASLSSLAGVAKP